MSCEWCKHPVATVSCPKCNLLHACSPECFSCMADVHSISCEAEKRLPQMTQQNDSPTVNIGTDESSIAYLPAGRFISDTSMVECPICFEVPTLGHLQEHTTCDTLYCMQCLSCLQQRRAKCVCGERLTAANCRAANRHIRGMHSLLKISCRYSNCHTVCSLEELAGHEKHCDFGGASCSQCQAVVLRKNYIDHRNNLCPDRLIKCKNCHQHLRADDEDTHHSSTCVGSRVKCEYCEEFYRRDVIVLHQTLKCANKPIKCRLGCVKEVPRKNMKEHERTCEYGIIECKFCHERIVKRELSRHQSVLCPDFAVQCTHAGCDESILRKHKAQHETKCEIRHIKCPHCCQQHQHRDQKEHIDKICEKVPTKCSMKCCSDIHPKYKISEHERMCSYRILKCNDCSISFKVRDEIKHEKNCPMIKVPVDKCGHSCLRRDLHQHYRENGYIHIPDLVRIICEKDNEIEKLQRKTQSLQSQLKIKKVASAGTKVNRKAQSRSSTTKHSGYISNTQRNMSRSNRSFGNIAGDDDSDGSGGFCYYGEEDDPGSRGTSPSGMFANNNW